MKSKHILAFLAGSAALVLMLTASKCESHLTFTDYKPEICTDKIDNDEDSLVDCQDQDCSKSCTIQIAIDSIPTLVNADSTIITGTQSNARSVDITISPFGIAGTTTLSGNTWQAKLSQLLNPGVYTVKAVATDSAQQTQTATRTFERAN